MSPLTAAIDVIEDLLNKRSASLNFLFFRSPLLFVFLLKNSIYDNCKTTALNSESANLSYQADLVYETVFLLDAFQTTFSSTNVYTSLEKLLITWAQTNLTQQEKNHKTYLHKKSIGSAPLSNR